jgi:hypothetical protein
LLPSAIGVLTVDSMQIHWGIDAGARKRGETMPVKWCSRAAVNGHCLLVGMSGSGKTHTLRRMIRDLIATSPVGAAPRIHIFDVHGDIEVDGASTVLFSEQTPYGINPLAVNPNPHFGGIRKRVQSFIRTLNRVTRQLGPKQEAVLRNILLDVYARHGFKQGDPQTWAIDESSARLVSDGSDNRLYIDVPRGEKDQLKDLKVGAQWDGNLMSWWIPSDQYQGAVTRWPPKTLARTHPTITDAMHYARHRLEMSFLGSGIDAITNLEIANRAASALQRKLLEALRRGERSYEDGKLQADIERCKVRAIDSYTEYVNAITSGREFSDLMKYDSTDVLKSVVDRLENLEGIGIFKATPPPFDLACPVWRYDIKALSMQERKLFVFFRLEEIFSHAVQRGTQSDIVEVIMLDECQHYESDDPDLILNVIGAQARKFGIALVMAGQSPTQFPEEFMASVSTKIILGIDEVYWRASATRLRVSEEALAWIRPQKSMLVQMKVRGDTRSDWRWTLLA